MYATIDEIRAASTRLTAIKEADDGEISLWMEEAADVINTFCSQDFSLEFNVTKTLNVNHPTVYLPKALSGDLTISLSGSAVGSDDYYYDGENSSLRYEPLSYYYSDPTKKLEPVKLSVTGIWGYAPSQEYIVIQVANDLKSKYDSHRASGSVHTIADTTNLITSPNATDLATAITLLNEIRADLIAHFADTSVHLFADPAVPAVGAATDITSALLLADDLVTKYNDHLDDDLVHIVPDTANRVLWVTDIPVLPRQVKRVFTRLVQRLALRADEEDQYQMNSGYASETTGDGYSYSLSDGTLRNLLRPEDREMLWPYMNRGRMIV